MSRVKARIKKLFDVREKLTVTHRGLALLAAAPGMSKTGAERVAMTISCRDSDYIAKVNGAGSMTTLGEQQYQLMHNGILVEAGGYFGDWMASIVKTLKGHHEPQEEKVFHELLKRIPAHGTMIELGSYWAYYSMWFNKAVRGATNYCCEPDPMNLELGKRNATVNKCENVNFILAAAGKDDGKVISFTPQEGQREDVFVPIRSVDSVVTEHTLERVDILHMDIQGAELTALEGAEASIRAGKVRFAVISTHHYSVSGDPLTHEKCLEKVRSLGGHIIAEHAIHESYSGDGLIAASFYDEDKDLSIEITQNRMQDSLFRSYNEDLAILLK